MINHSFHLSLYRISCIASILLISIAVSACGNQSPLRPAPWIMSMMPENGSEMYKQAWKDGCETGMASMTNSYYKTFYSFRQNKDLLNNATYYKVWQDTYNFCRHYAYGLVRESGTRFKTPDQATTSLEDGNITRIFGTGAMPHSLALGVNGGFTPLLQSEADNFFSYGDVQFDDIDGTGGLFW